MVIEVREQQQQLFRLVLKKGCGHIRRTVRDCHAVVVVGSDVAPGVDKEASRSLTTGPWRMLKV